MSVLTQILMQGTLDGQSLRDIKPPLDVPQSLLPYFISSAVILGLITFLVWAYIRKRSRTLPVPVTEELNAPLAHEVAYEKLAAIAASKWLTRGDMETYHTEIAYVLREYIRARYQIPALALTTTRLVQALLHGQIDTPCVERIQQLLANCDMVKFAPYQPEVSKASARIADARWIVDQTKSPIP